MALAYFSEWYHAKKEREDKLRRKKTAPIFVPWQDR
jgi:hypothetical protein